MDEQTYKSLVRLRDNNIQLLRGNMSLRSRKMMQETIDNIRQQLKDAHVEQIRDKRISKS